MDTTEQVFGMFHNHVNLINIERKDDIQHILPFSTIPKVHDQTNSWCKPQCGATDT